MRNKLLIAVISLLSFQATAQQMTTTNPRIIAGIPNLNVGDQLPDFAVGKLINTTLKTMNTAEFKDRLLIIDFWSIYCSGCVAALPKMAALQKQFGNKIKVLPVSYDKKTDAEAFWKNNKYTKNLTISSVIEDKLFESYFRHKTIPHEVWVYKGKVTAITGPDYVDANNIQKVLSGAAIDWPVKNDFYSFNGNEQPLFAADPNQVDTASTLIKYAAISDYKEGVNSEGLSGGSGIIRDAKKKTVRAFFLNQPIYTSYITTWLKLADISLMMPIIQNPEQVVWEVTDKTKYMFDAKLSYQQDYVRKNGICYESLNPDTGQTDKEIYKNMISDLDRLLGLHVRWEKREENGKMVDKFVFTEVNGGLIADGKMIAEATTKLAAQKDMKNPAAAENNAFLAANKLKPGVITLPSGLQYKIIRKGTGTNPVLNDTAIIHYTGTLVNGKIFESSYENGKPSNIQISETIKGWQEALPLMTVGSKWILYIPAELAYAEHTGRGKFPPNSNVIFEVELISIVK